MSVKRKVPTPSRPERGQSEQVKYFVRCYPNATYFALAVACMDHGGYTYGYYYGYCGGQAWADGHFRVRVSARKEPEVLLAIVGTGSWYSDPSGTDESDPQVPMAPGEESRLELVKDTLEQRWFDIEGDEEPTLKPKAHRRLKRIGPGEDLLFVSEKMDYAVLRAISEKWGCSIRFE